MSVTVAVLLLLIPGYSRSTDHPVAELRDTLEVRHLLEKAERHWALYQWDSVGSCASRALIIVQDLLADPNLEGDLVHWRSLIRLKARSLGQLGRTSHEGKDEWYLDSALNLVTSVHDLEGEAMLLMYRSEVFYERGRYSDAIRSAKMAVDIHRELGDDLKAARYLNMSGEYYRVMGDPSAALEIHLEALPIVEASGDLVALAWNCILIGAVHRATEDWDRALEYFYRARQYYEKADDPIGIAIAYNDLGTAYFGSGNMDSAMHWHSRSAELRERIGSFDGLGHSLRYMARVHERNGEFNKAVAMYRSAIASYQRVPFLTAMATTHGHIASVLMKTGDLPAALDELTKALDLLVDRRERAEIPALFYRLAEIHRLQGNTAKAVSAYKDGLVVAGSLNDHAAIATGRYELFRTYMGSGRLREAFESHQLFMTASDSVQLTAQRSSVLRSMMRHDLEQERIRERAKAEAERSLRRIELEGQQRQKYVYIAGGSLFGILAIGLVGRLRYTANAQRRMERQRIRLEEAKSRAERSERFKERFLANMSHEIRTPMNAIMGMTAIMRRNDHLDAQRNYLDAIAKSSKDLLGILNDILDLSKLDAGRMDLESLPMDPVQVLDRISLDMREMAVTAGIELAVERNTSGRHRVLGDPMRMEQIVADLVENAIKFTKVGSVRLSLDVGRLSQRRVELIFRVVDTGPGIPDGEVDRIFNEFTKVYSDGDRKYGGTGLGLTLSKRLAEAMGGSLTVESELGVGSIFTARIPCTIVEDHAIVSSKGSISIDLSGSRILLADDNAFNVMVAQDELMDAIPDVRVDVAVNGKQAVAMAKVNRYDAVLMDVQMPELSGYDATREIRALGGHHALIPILAMTANVMRGELERCREAGMDDIVPKPFERKDLLEKLSEAMRKGIT